jgi:hypothetical protein
LTLSRPDVKQLLIVSPNFPPVNAADMHRIRMSLPEYAAHGWSPVVLAVGGAEGRVVEEDLLRSVPESVPVLRVGALPGAVTSLAGVRNVTLRALGHLYRAGLRLIRSHSIDLVYFSTTVFPAMALGRIWKAQTGVPFVVDMQDPWVNEYLDRHPEARPPKYGLARRVHGLLEPFTMRAVDGIIAVSPAYHGTLRTRYPWITREMCATIPFGAAEEDMRLARELNVSNPWFTAGDGLVHAVYVGRGGEDLHTAATIFFRALSQTAGTGQLANLRLWCIGTDYAPAGTGRPTLTPVAAREGVAARVVESPARVPYFQALRVLQDADVLVILGSEDPQYSPSKVYPYLLARRPVVAIVHEDSPVVPVLQNSGAGPVVTFRGRDQADAAVEALVGVLPSFVGSGHAAPTVRQESCAPWLAPELTRRQCEMFDAVLARTSGRR